MPRKYIRKRPKPTYTQEDLANAVNDILNRNRTYKEVEDTYVNNIGLSNKPSFVFNDDESGSSTDPKRLKAIGEKDKPLSRISGGSSRESTTILATVSADGYCLHPLIIFKGVAVQAGTYDKAYPDTMYTCSSNGWIFQWFSASFIPHVKIFRKSEGLLEQAVILMYDGHSSHISYRIVKSALDNNIHLLKFPSSQTYVCLSQ
ncbi:hypothetical protein JTB14_005791 [Gonioctena quinquepunctata]|nr:hypothetical protein JTB14_005791 [Gonioctena quinquepunctata]